MIFHIVFTLFVMSFSIYLIIKKVKAQSILLFAGLVLMFYSYITGLNTQFLNEKQSTNSAILDMFAYIRHTLAKDLSTLGLTIMCGAGFAKYMDMIGASTRMVMLLTRPLKSLNAPYIVCALGFSICMILSLAIQSASALATLTMVTIFPILRRLGVSALAAASVVASGHLLDIGPAAATSLVVSKYADISIEQLFVEHQLPVYAFCGIFATIAHYFWQKHLDKKDKSTDIYIEEEQKNENIAPKYYVLLPILPLFFILFFSQYGIYKLGIKIKIDIVTAMLLSFFIAMCCEFIRYKNYKEVAASIQIFFDGMGRMFAITVTLISAAKVFAYGITCTGLIDAFTSLVSSLGLSASVVTLGVSIIIILLSFATGSGVAIVYSFAPIIPQFANAINADALTMLHSMQNAASLGRLLSPVAAVIIIVSSLANVNAFKLVKRNSLPVFVAIIVSMLSIIFI